MRTSWDICYLDIGHVHVRTTKPLRKYLQLEVSRLASIIRPRHCTGYINRFEEILDVYEY